MGAVGRLALAEQQVVRPRSTIWPRVEAERLGALRPTSGRGFSAALAGLDAIPGRVLGSAAVDLAPGCNSSRSLLGRVSDYRHRPLPNADRRQRELTMIIKWCMGVTASKIMTQW